MRYIYKVPASGNRSEYWTYRGIGKWTAEEVRDIRERAHAQFVAISRLVG